MMEGVEGLEPVKGLVDSVELFEAWHKIPENSKSMSTS